MFELSSLPRLMAHKHIAAYAAIVAFGGFAGGYAIHEHRVAQNLAAQNERTTAALNTTERDLIELTTRVNMLVARSQTQPPAPAAAPDAPPPPSQRAAAPRRPREDPRLKKLQSQLDAQNKAIAQTQGDLASARTELTGSIAHTHGELVVLQRRGERNYTEFDLSKSKDFRREGPFSIRLRKADNKHQFADLELIVDDRTLSEKHVNLYRPVMFYTPDSPQPVEVVINDIGKNHIHGYVSAPKYRQSELASNGGTNAMPASVQEDSSQPPPQRKKLPKPQ